MVIQSTRIWIAGQFLAAQLVAENGKITGVLPAGTRPVDQDYGDRRILPGFLDVHTHGAYGFDTNDARPEGLREWMRRIPEEGVTAILPTTVTQLPEVLTAALRNVATVVREGYEGAEILGVHFEGPYLDMEYKGAQPPEAIAEPSVEQFRKYQDAAEGLIRCITLAPEHDREYALIRYCRENGVVVSMGHSRATYEQALLAIANGAAGMTHVFNAMSGFHPRNPGLIGAALRMRDVYGEIICDGVHSVPSVLNSFFQAKERSLAVMVTDSLCVKHCPPGGVFFLGGHEIEVGEDGAARLAGTDTIAGSTLSMNRGLKILVEDALVPFDAAVNSCTLNPARYLGVDNRKGRIAAGCDADLVVLEDDYEVCQTFCRGKAML